MGKQWDEFIKKAKYTEPQPIRHTSKINNKKSDNNENIQKTKTKEYDLSGVSQQIKGLQTSKFNPISFLDNNYRFIKKTLGIGNAKKGVEDDLISIVDKSYEFGKNLGSKILKNNKNQENENKKSNIKEENKKRNDWINTGAFDEGLTPGNILRAAVNTKRDYLNQFSKGAYGTGESAVDLAFNVASGFTDEKTAKKIRELTTRDFTGEMYNNDKDIDKNSLLGTYLQNVSQAEGNLAAQIALKEAGVPWQLTAFASSAGSEMNNAFSNNASYGQALMSGIISGAVEIGTEYIGGGSNKVLGMTSLGSKTLEKLGGKISNKLISKLAKLGIDAGGEGFEEILSGIGNSIGQRLTYMDEGNLKKLLDNDIDLDEFLNNTISNVSEGIGKYLKTDAKQDLIVGSLAGLSGNGNVILQGNNVNAFTGLTDTQKAAFDKEYNRRIQEIEKDGEKLTSKEKDKIYDEVKNEIETITKIDQFRNNAVENYPTLDDQNRILYNNMINDISSLIKITNSDIRFDQNLNKLNTWNNNTLVINPSMTDMPVKTLFLKELGNNIINEETKSNLIDKLKENGTYDTIKQELLNQGIEEENIDNEIASLELNSIFENNKKLKEFIQNNQEDIQKISSIVNELSKNITQNTKDFNYMNSLSNKINSLNINENNLSTKELQEVKQQEEIEQKQSSTKEAVSDEKQQETNKYTKVEEKPLKSSKNGELEDVKGKQLKIIKESNPMTDDYHVGIREKSDIKTFKEAIEDEESFTWGDFTKEDAEKALENGKITVYSSNPIKNGAFVSTSQNQARDYAGGKKIYSKEVPLNEVAWINGDEGQYAKIEEANKNEVKQEEKVEKSNEVKKESNKDLSKQRKTYKSVIESDSQTKEAKEISKKLLGTDTYIPDSNKDQLDRADDYINKYGVDETLKTLKEMTESSRNNVDDIAIGNRLIEYYSKIGDKEKIEEAMQLTAMAGTNLGRGVQAMSLLNRLTPAGQATWIQRSVDKMNKQLKEAYDKSHSKKKTLQQFNFTTEMKEKIINSTPETLEQNLNEVYEELGNQVQMSKLEALDSWRYFAMLSSPTTHVRNIVGNLMMGKVQDIKDKIKGGIEDIYYNGKEGERTSTFKKPTKEYFEFARKDMQNVRGPLGIGDNKYTNPKNQLQQNMRMFGKSKVGEFLEKYVKKCLIDKTSDLLSGEDAGRIKILGKELYIGGLEAAYTKSMARYLYANNIDIKNITDSQLSKARRFAIEQAKQATFHQDSSLASALNTLENKNLAAKFIIGGVVPFKKTPFNVAKTSLSYNPVGLLKTLTYDSKRLYDGKITTNQYIDNLAKGLTGTAIAVVGYAMAQAGWIKTSGSDDDDFEKDKGKNPYSLIIKDKSFTLDWLSPTAVPLFVGAELQKQFDNLNGDKTEDEKNKSIKDSIESVLEAGVSSLNPVSEMTMLSGIQSALKTYSGDYAKMAEEVGTNTIKNYVSQVIPSILGKIAKSTDKYERATTSTKKNTVSKAIDSFLNQSAAKIPGARLLLPKKTNVWGEEVESINNPLLRTLYNFASPATITTVRKDEVDDEIESVYKETGEKSVIPKTYISKEFNYDDKKYRLTNKEYQEYKKIFGELNYDSINSIIGTDAYDNLTENEKASVIKDIYEFNNDALKVAYAKAHDIDYESSKKTETQIEDLGGNVGEYYIYKAGLEKGDTTYIKKAKLRDSDISKTTKSAIYESSISKSSLDLYKVLKEDNVDIDEYLDYLSKEFKADKRANGTIINGSKKNKEFKYMNNESNLTLEQKTLILGKGYSVSSAEKDYIVNRILVSDLTKDEKEELLNSIRWVKVSKDGTVRW